MATENLKKKLVERIDESMDATDIANVLYDIFRADGLKENNGTIVPGVFKGHWRTKNNFTIYKSECSCLTGGNRLCVEFSKYGVGDKTMFCSVDSIVIDSLTRERELDAKIWADLNDGIVNKTYQ